MWSKPVPIVVAFLILMMALSAIPYMSEGSDEEPLDLLDAYITGTVVNGTSGIKVSCQAMKRAGSGPQVRLYFNGTTDVAGAFNITVDSNSTDEPALYFLDPYSVVVEETYYLSVAKGSHNFDGWIQKGETFEVPAGALEMTDAPLGDLTVRIMNGSSGEPLSDVRVSMEHPPSVPPIPFVDNKITDASGEVDFEDVRAEDVLIEASRENFRDLSSTVSENTGIVVEGTTTVLQFNLTENPWPFSTDPSSGAVSANVTRGILVEFGTEMDPASIMDPSNYGLKSDSSSDVQFNIMVVGSGNESVRIIPVDPLQYDANHTFSISPSIVSLGGWNLLWRTMDVSFHTEKRPGIVSGKFVETGSLEPVAGMEIELVDQAVTTDSDGFFTFPLVIDGTYDLTVDESYLFEEFEVEDIVVSRGDLIDLGNLPIDPKTHGSMNVEVTSGGEPLSGAWVKVLSSFLDEDEFNLTTNSTGLTFFERVRTGNVNLKIGAPHHSIRIDVGLVPENGVYNLSVDLVKDEAPVEVQLTEERSPGIAEITSDILLLMPEAIDFSTLDVVLWRMDDGSRGEEVTLMAPQTGEQENSYLIRVQGQLSMESGYELVVDGGLLSLSGSVNILWEDLVYSFSTPDFSMSHIIGTVLVEGEPLEGIIVEFSDAMATTDDEGRVNLTYDPDAETTPGNLTIDLRESGYDLYDEAISLSPGEVYDLGTISLLPRIDWYSVVPGDGSENVDPETNITFTFAVGPDPTSLGWSDLISVVKEGMSAPVAGTFSASDQNRSVVFDPALSLQTNAIYEIVISDRMIDTGGHAMFPVGNTTSFRVVPPSLEVTVISPAEPSSVALDEVVRLSFGVGVNRSLVEEGFDFTPSVSVAIFDWISDTELEIEALFSTSTDYSLSLAPGVYGLGDEPLVSEFRLEFQTGDGYGLDHSFSSINLIPDPEGGWKTGQNVTVSGTVDRSKGYEIKVTIESREWTTTVNDDGSWSLDLTLPSESIKGTLKVAVGVPGGPAAYSKDYQVEIREPGEESHEDEDDMTLYIIIIVVIVIVAVVLAALLYMRARRKSAEKEMDVEYTEVDGDWEDDEE